MALPKDAPRPPAKRPTPRPSTPRPRQNTTRTAARPNNNYEYRYESPAATRRQARDAAALRQPSVQQAAQRIGRPSASALRQGRATAPRAFSETPTYQVGGRRYAQAVTLPGDVRVYESTIEALAGPIIVGGTPDSAGLQPGVGGQGTSAFGPGTTVEDILEMPGHPGPNILDAVMRLLIDSFDPTSGAGQATQFLDETPQENPPFERIVRPAAFFDPYGGMKVPLGGPSNVVEDYQRRRRAARQREDREMSSIALPEQDDRQQTPRPTPSRQTRPRDRTARQTPTPGSPQYDNPSNNPTREQQRRSDARNRPQNGGRGVTESDEGKSQVTPPVGDEKPLSGGTAGGGGATGGPAPGPAAEALDESLIAPIDDLGDLDAVETKGPNWLLFAIILGGLAVALFLSSRKSGRLVNIAQGIGGSVRKVASGGGK